MEVHAHSHTARKKWTHYFWEFLMLFLAVFCGFLAENQREHIVERHRAREYAKSLLGDMRLDTGELRRGIQVTRFTISSIDSIIAISQKMNAAKAIPKSFYFYSKFISQSFRVDWSKATIDQLIQSGNLRYFRNKELVSLLNNYYSQQSLIAGQNQIEGGHRDKTMELRNNILLNHYYFLEDFNYSSTSMPSGEKDSSNFEIVGLQENAIAKMDTYLNYLVDRKWRLGILIKYYIAANQNAMEIIEAINSTYHFERSSK
jgi:hypothetical protein